MEKGVIEYSVVDLLKAMGEDFKREGLKDTPARVARMYSEIFEGYGQDPEKILERTFSDEDHHEMVIVRDIDFFSHCEHHMVPFFGKVHIAYIPNGRVVGLSKLVRLVECYAHRLQIQERMVTQIADAIEKSLEPLGVMVVIEAEHLCMKMRGVKNACADTVTSAVRGAFMENPETRAEFLSLIGR